MVRYLTNFAKYLAHFRRTFRRYGHLAFRYLDVSQIATFVSWSAVVLPRSSRQLAVSYVLLSESLSGFCGRFSFRRLRTCVFARAPALDACWTRRSVLGEGISPVLARAERAEGSCGRSGTYGGVPISVTYAVGVEDETGFTVEDVYDRCVERIKALRNDPQLAMEKALYALAVLRMNKPEDIGAVMTREQVREMRMVLEFFDSVVAEVPR